MIEELYQKYLKNPVISTDSRKIEKDCLFFALKGANFNGNEFAEKALDLGAQYAIVDEKEFVKSSSYILVKDVLTTLQQLANHHRRQFQIPFIAVGGSNGKTTTKELIHRVLAKKYKAFATPGNLNNHIGLPLTLLQIQLDTEIAIIEMGANHEGEIMELCEITEPTHGIITNIGLDHLEGFGSIEGVARANQELFYFLMKHQGLAFVNTQEDRLVDLAKGISEIKTYPETNDYFQAAIMKSDFFLKFKTEKGEVVDTKLFGDYNFANVATALCIGKYFEVPSEDANEAVATYEPSNNRSQILEKGNNVILLDAYNANPSSMEKALANVSKVSQKKKAVILGDMYELGVDSEKEHERLGKILSGMDLDMIILHGEEVKSALKHASNAYYFPDKFSLHNWLQDKALDNYFILIKGSRGIQLETVVNFI